MERNRFWLLLIPLLLARCVPATNTPTRDEPEADRIPFTRQLRAENHLTTDEVRSLQFYLARTITLNRALASGEPRRVTHGRLVLREGRYIEEVVVDDGTPGIALGVNDDYVDISFEKGSSNLRFGSDPGFRSGPGTYGLWRRWSNGGWQVQFDGREYSAIGESALAYLEIDRQALLNVVTKRRVLPGRRISP